MQLLLNELMYNWWTYWKYNW